MVEFVCYDGDFPNLCSGTIKRCVNENVEWGCCGGCV